MTAFDPSTPVILLGGRENAVAVARNLGRRGVEIIASGLPGCRSLNSKYCKRGFSVPKGRTAASYWEQLLLGNDHRDLDGAILFAFCDESLEFVEAHHERLRDRYVVEDFVADQRRAMLDKQETLAIAKKADVPFPAYWPINTDDDVHRLKDKIRFPVMVKPLNSYAFVHEFGAKLFIVPESFEEVVEKVLLSRSRGHDVMVVEMVPGPDDLLCSYYTYRTPYGRRLYDYTKSVMRRWPVNRGGGCMHQSEWLPEVAALGQKLFEAMDWQGTACVEFKRDTRDGLLKIIEVNARFTAAHRLVTEAGAPIDLVIYCYLTKQPEPSCEGYSNTIRMWNPVRDILAFRDLRRLGELSFTGWVRSITEQRVILGYLSLDDPGPSLAETGANIRRAFSKLTGVFRRRGQHAT